MSDNNHEKSGYVTVYEASGGGGPDGTLWQFFVDDLPVTHKIET
ncbi:hypothetical protein IWQ49_005734 [Labrenzia sp. EL_126]|nr:hypothetical protein [Labrenzia sp. EL_126]